MAEPPAGAREVLRRVEREPVEWRWLGDPPKRRRRPLALTAPTRPLQLTKRPARPAPTTGR